MGCQIVDAFSEGEEMSERLIRICKDIFHSSFLFVEFMSRGNGIGDRLVRGTEGIEFGVQCGEVGSRACGREESFYFVYCLCVSFFRLQDLFSEIVQF